MIGRRRPPEAAEDNDLPKGFDDFELRLGDVMRGERATLGKSLLDVQRELKIKATYIAAIENADPSAFETPGFIAGYVRSYARYLDMDPEWAYAKFCFEADFETAHGLDAAASSPKPVVKKTRAENAGDPLSDPNALFVPRTEGLFSRIEPGAIGSSLVLLALIGGLGFGGWSALKEIQKVRLAPVDEAPTVVADLDPVAATTQAGSDAETQRADLILPTPEAFDRLYRPEPLDVPRLIARDAPIATLEPGSVGVFADLDTVQVPTGPRVAASDEQGFASGVDAAVLAALGETNAPENGNIQVVANNAPEVVVFATRPAWVRVTSAEGTVLFEKILDAGERYVLPATEEAPLLRTGYAGAVYFALDGQVYGPAGTGGEVVKNIALASDALRGAYQLADLDTEPGLASLVAEVTQPISQ